MLTDSLVQHLKRRFKAAQTDLSFLILHKSQHGPLVISLGGNTAPRVQFCTIYSGPHTPSPQITSSSTWPVFNGSLQENHSVSQKKRLLVRLLVDNCGWFFYLDLTRETAGSWFFLIAPAVWSTHNNYALDLLCINMAMWLLPFAYHFSAAIYNNILCSTAGMKTKEVLATQVSRKINILIKNCIILLVVSDNCIWVLTVVQGWFYTCCF